MTEAWRSGRWLVLPVALLLVAATQGTSGRPFVAAAAAIVALGASIVLALVRWPHVRWLTPALAPILVGCSLALVGASDRGATISDTTGDVGFVDRAAALTAIGMAVLGLLAAGVDVGAHVARVVQLVGRGITVGAGTVLFAIIVLPGWAWTRLRRRDVLRTTTSGTTWTDRSGTSARPASVANGPAGTRSQRGLVGRVTWAVGCVVLLAAANFGIGWAWDESTDSRGPRSLEATVRPAATGDVPRDPRNDHPAMAAYPWRERYFADIQRTGGTYWPFTESRPLSFESPYVNIDGWARRSYEAAGDPDGMPVVWMFGGSTTWGEGQRDEYTIASWLARLAEQAGLPVQLANYGQRGWTHFQEMILYEQRLAAGPAPDFSLFYDGANEITTQSLLEEAVPSHVLAYTYAQRLSGSTIATELVQQPPPDDPLGDLWYAYSDHSAIHKVARLFQSAPAGAAPRRQTQPEPEPEAGDGFTGGQDQEGDGGIYEYNITAQDGTDAGQVYERVKPFTMLLSERYDVQSFLFWQPVGFLGEPQDRARAELTDSTIDTSRILVDHPEVFIDGGHTNEEGARLVAIEIWDRIAPAVRRWYEDR